MKIYNLSGGEYRMILLALAVPSVVAWLAAFWGYANLKQYSKYLAKTPEGDSFNKLAGGYGWLAWSLPVTSITSLFLNSISYRWSGFHSTAIILTNYLNVLVPLIAFSIIGIATRALVNEANIKFNQITTRLILFFFLTTGVLYCYFTFRNFNLADSLATSNNPYFLPVWLIVLTIIIPSLYAWFVGLLASYELNLFSKHVRGVLYRQALRLLAGGLIVVITSSIAIQYINGVEPSVGHLVISHKLLLILCFRIIRAIGLLLFMLGAIKLKKIEEV